MDIKNFKNSLETKIDYEILFEKTGMGMAILESDGTLSLVNKKLAQLLKTDVSVMIKSSFFDWVSDIDKKTMEGYHTKRLKGHDDIPESYEFRLMCQDGSTSWALINLTFFKDTGRTLLSVLDINKLKQTEQELKEAISSQNAILLALPDLMFELDSNGVYLNIWTNNPQELAATKKELLGHTVGEMLADDASKQVMIAIQDANEKGYSLGRQIHIQTHEGKLWFELSISIKHNENSANTFIVLSRNITDRKNLEIELLHLSHHDPLTNLYNRRVLEERLSKDIQRASRYKVSLSICMLDIDYFKNINDTYGHSIGDMVLKKLSRMIEDALRTTDYTARYGGEEFLIVLADTSLSSTEEFAERLRKQVEEMTIELENKEIIKITVSIGISTFTQERASLDTLISSADLAMYQAKESGRNCIIATK